MINNLNVRNTTLSIFLLLSLPSAASAQQSTLIRPVDNVDLSPRQSAALNALRTLPTTEDVQIVRVDPKALMTAEQVLVPMKSKAQFAVQMASRDTRADGLVARAGQAPERPEGSTSIVVNGENVTASILSADGLYRVRPIGNGLHALVKVDTGKLPAEHPPSFQERRQQLQDIPPFVRKPATDTSITQISVLVGYTPAVEKKVVDVKGLVLLAFAETNQSYKNSNIYINLTAGPADPLLVNVTESGSMDDELAAFMNVDQVRQTRKQSKANLAVLLIDDSSYCGLARQILATNTTAFAVVYHDCATGYYSFGHELGHLQGARHNPEVDNESSPFPYGHGFMDQPRQRRTVMSYDCPGSCTRMPQWARPPDWGNSNISYDAKVLNETANYVAGLHQP